MTPRDALDFAAIRVLDGGLATELERRGCLIDGPLWSAHVLDRAPDALAGVHMDYLRAGADCLATVSYQISAVGYRDLGLTTREAASAARRALVQSVRVAAEARSQYAQESPRRVWIAASLGPYGAALHNGAEYHGRYDIDGEALVAFHSERLAVLAETRADLVAFETIPSLEEGKAIVRALAEFPDMAAWIAFTCRNGVQVAHGEPLQDCAATVSESSQLVAVGINCTAPALIPPLLAAVRKGCHGRNPVVVYPNSGEVWDAATRSWHGEDNTADFGKMARLWFAAGAHAVGGCCRTRPAHIAEVARAAAAAVSAGPP